METKKKKLEVENAIANWDYCIACLACYNPLVIYAVAVGVVVVAGE